MASTRAGRSGSNRFLPPDPRVEEPYRFTPQLALRLGILGAVALIAFGILFFRLWALQVLSGPQYLRAALDNQVRTVRVEGRAGRSSTATASRSWTTSRAPRFRSGRPTCRRPGRPRLAELRQLSHVLRVPLRQLLVDIKRRGNDPITPVTVRESVNRDAPILYLAEHRTQFPGVGDRGHVPQELQLRHGGRPAARLRVRDLA